jgi:hypothetical protein
MYEAKWIAVVSLIIVVSGLVRTTWITVLFGVAGLVLSSYVLLVFEKEAIKGPSLASQATLATMGALVLSAVYAGIDPLMSASRDPSPDPLLVSGGFLLLTIAALFGTTMVICALISRKMSHQMLRYFVKVPDQLKGRWS